MPLPFLESALCAVVHASWQAAILVLVVLVASRLVPRMPAGAKSGLWLIVLARLLFPLTPQSSWSLFNLARFSAGPRAAAAPTADSTTGTERPASVPQVEALRILDPGRVPPPALRSGGASEFKDNRQRSGGDGERAGVLLARAPSIAGVVSSIWALGVAVVVASGIRSWFRLRRFLRTCALCGRTRPGRSGAMSPRIGVAAEVDAVGERRRRGSRACRCRLSADHRFETDAGRDRAGGVGVALPPRTGARPPLGPGCDPALVVHAGPALVQSARLVGRFAGPRRG